MNWSELRPQLRTALFKSMQLHSNNGILNIITLNWGKRKKLKKLKKEKCQNTSQKKQKIEKKPESLIAKIENF